MSGSGDDALKGKSDKDIYEVLTPTGFGKALKELQESNTSAEAFMKTIGTLDNEAFKVAKSFGSGVESVDRIKDSLLASRDEVIKLGGTWDDMIKNQNETSAALGRNVLLGVEGQKELFAASKVTGQAVGTIVGNLKDVGISAYDAGDAMSKVVNAAREQGVSAQKVSDMVLKNVSYMNTFNFKDGVEGLAKMAAQATAMRIDMRDIMNVAEKAFNPEGAIKMAAELQRLGVTQSELLDPLNLMNLAENDPAELQKQIGEMSKQFVQMNEKGQFEILPGAKRQLREIEKSLGMSAGSLSKMALSSAEAEEKMKRIRFPDFVSEDQKKYLANIAEMKDGKMMIEVNGESMQLDEVLAKGNKEEIDKLIESTKPKSMEEMAKSQLSVLDDINIGINLLNGIVPTAFAGTKMGKEAPRTIGSQFRGKSEELIDTFGGTKGLTKSMSGVVDELNADIKKIKVEDLKKKMEGFVLGLEDLKNRISKFQFSTGSTISDVATQLDIPQLKEIAEPLKTLTTRLNGIFGNFTQANDAILSPSLGTIKTLPEDDIVIGTGISEMFSKMIELKGTAKIENVDLSTKLPKVGEEKKTTLEKESGLKEMKIDLNINVTAPPQIDTNEITKVLKDQLVVQQLIQKMEQVMSNNNLTKTPK